MSKVTAVIDCASGQWILNKFGTNGGEVVVMRAAFITLWLAACAICVQALVDPARKGPPSLYGLQSQLVDLAGWITAFFGAAYLALYTRFVSQWSYLANVYNQIKQAESAHQSNSKVIAQWKAGFLEDADHLHLVEKGSLAPVIAAWGKEAAVATAFDTSTPGGQLRRERIVRCADRKCSEIAAREARSSR